MLEPHQLTLTTAAAALEEGSVTSRGLCEALLERSAALEPTVHAFLRLDADAILAAADASDRRRRADDPLSRYDGVPVALKDNLSDRGQPCTCASRILEGYTASYDATAVARLKQAGVVPFGRTNMDEFAMGSSTENSGFHASANPWDATRVPGGSSGGSAAAVAAREVTAALGSDTGGSIRQPAGFCGVVGLKPTYGRVSRYGLVAFASSLDQIGPLSRSVEDAAVLLDLISGHDPRDATSLPQAPTRTVDAVRDDIRGLRIGLPREYLDVGGLSADVRAAVDAAAQRFRSLGAETVDISLPHTRYAIAAYYIIATAEASANLARFDGVRYGARDRAGEKEGILELYRQSRAAGFGQEVKRRIILGTYVLSSGYYDAYYLRAQKVRTLVRQDFTRAFEACDAILSPVSPTPAFRSGDITDPLQMYLADIYTISVNLAGIPALSIPAGTDAEGLPIGIQLMGPALGEEQLVRAAGAFEADAGQCPQPEL